MRAIAWAAAAGAALIVVYLALGGASYAPAKVADPCAPRDWRDPQGVEEVAEQIALSGLDGAACELHVSREKMVLALANSQSRERFAREHGISNQRLEELVRRGLLRAIDDAEQAGALDPTVADLLRGIARRVPVDELLDLLKQLPGL
jgi:AcrR family transcriptional regulator